MSNKHTVLIADDEELFRRSLADVLEVNGYRTVMAADGDAAWQLLRLDGFSLALVDIHMPRKGGIEVLSELAALSHAPPVIMMTAHRLEGYARRLEAEKALALFTKPLDVADLLETMKLCCSKSRAQCE